MSTAATRHRLCKRFDGTATSKDAFVSLVLHGPSLGPHRWATSRSRLRCYARGLELEAKRGAKGTEGKEKGFLPRGSHCHREDACGLAGRLGGGTFEC